jgi:hypothetical protein
MSIKDQISDGVKQAMRDKQNDRRDALRGLLAAIRQVEVDQQKSLSDDEVIKVLMSEVKRRRESIEAFEQGGRAADAEKERAELSIIETYLPRQLSRAEIEAIVREAIAEVQAGSAQDIGKVMSLVMPKLRGQADGKLVNEVVRDLLR